MRIREAAFELRGPKAARTSWQIITRAEGAPRPTFQSILYFDFECGRWAESLHIEELETRLEGMFLPLTYDLRTLKDTRIRSWDASGILVEAPIAPHLLEVVFSQGKIPASGYELQLFPIGEDGRPSDHPIQVVANGQRMERRYDGGEYIIIPGRDSAPGNFEIDPKLQQIVVVAGTPHFWIGRVMQRFLIRIVPPGGGFLKIGPDDLLQLRVQSYPTNPRIGIVLPRAGVLDGTHRPEEAHFFWRAPGEVRSESSVGPGSFSGERHFASELTRLLRRYLEAHSQDRPVDRPPPLPPTLTLGLVFESDAPCEVHDFALQIEYLLERNSFPDGSAKELFRFDAGRRSTRPLQLSIPAGIIVRRAILPLDLNLRADRDLIDESSEPMSAASAREGVHLHEGMRALQAFHLDSPVLATGVTLELLALSSSPEVQLQLQEDLDGSPGRILANVDSVVRDPAGAIARPALSFPVPVLLASRSYWLSLRTRSGSLLWLTGNSAESRVHLQRESSDGIDQSTTLLPGVRALYWLRSRSSGSPIPPLRIRHGTTDADLVREESSGALHADLLAPVEAFVRAGPQSAELLTLTLEVEATGPGTITCLPPRLLYDLGGKR